MTKPRTFVHGLLLSSGVTLSLGLLELLRSCLAGRLDLTGGARSLATVVLAYGLLGLACGVLARLRTSRGLALVFGSTVGVIAAVAVASSASRPVVFAAGLALGGFVGGAAMWLAGRLVWLQNARAWWALACLLAAACVGLCLPAPQDPRFALGLAALSVPAVGAAATLVFRRLSWPWPAPVALVAMLAALAGLFDTYPIRTGGAGVGDKTSVLLVTIDTLRADSLGAYGHTGARTPVLDALAKRGTLFREAVAHSAYTGPSHGSILTGLLPSTHGFQVNYQGFVGEHRTLADRLRDEGYMTLAFPSAWTTTAAGLPDSFEYVDSELRQHPWLPQAAYEVILLRPVARILERLHTWPIYRPAGATSARAARLLQRLDSQPFFAWVHYFDPHLPYAPPPELVAEAAPEQVEVSGRWYVLSAHERRDLIRSEAKMQRMRALYDAEVHYVDRELAAVIDAAERAAAGRLLIVVTSDHGEPFGEHGRYYERDLYDPTLRVPLLIIPPKGREAGVAQVSAQVRSIDIAPTIMEYLGLTWSGPLDGQSLQPLMSGATQEGPPEAISVYVPEPDMFRAPAKSVRTREWKLIKREAGFVSRDTWAQASSELYDLAQDPGELRDLAADQPEQQQRLSAHLADVEDNAQERHELNEQEREQLKALGYIQ